MMRVHFRRMAIVGTLVSSPPLAFVTNGVLMVNSGAYFSFPSFEEFEAIKLNQDAEVDLETGNSATRSG